MKGHPSREIFIKAMEGHLIGEERRVFFQHIIECEECRFKYSQLRLHTESPVDTTPSPIARFAFIALAIFLFLLFGKFSSNIQSHSLPPIQLQQVGYTDSTLDLNEYRIERIYVDTAILNLYHIRGQELYDGKLWNIPDDFLRIGDYPERDSS